uniref:RNA-directed RNA polymerase n=1 Tax=Rhizoctonia solani toti-like virus 1 TaxID=3095224 RepID=A0AAU6NDX4_9VIRU
MALNVDTRNFPKFSGGHIGPFEGHGTLSFTDRHKLPQVGQLAEFDPRQERSEIDESSPLTLDMGKWLEDADQAKRRWDGRSGIYDDSAEFYAVYRGVVVPDSRFTVGRAWDFRNVGRRRVAWFCGPLATWGDRKITVQPAVAAISGGQTTYEKAVQEAWGAIMYRFGQNGLPMGRDFSTAWGLVSGKPVNTVRLSMRMAALYLMAAHEGEAGRTLNIIPGGAPDVVEISGTENLARAIDNGARGMNYIPYEGLLGSEVNEHMLSFLQLVGAARVEPLGVADNLGFKNFWPDLGRIEILFCGRAQVANRVRWGAAQMWGMICSWCTRYGSMDEVRECIKFIMLCTVRTTTHGKEIFFTNRVGYHLPPYRGEAFAVAPFLADNITDQWRTEPEPDWQLMVSTAICTSKVLSLSHWHWLYRVVYRYYENGLLNTDDVHNVTTVYQAPRGRAEIWQFILGGAKKYGVSGNVGRILGTTNWMSVGGTSLLRRLGRVKKDVIQWSEMARYGHSLPVNAAVWGRLYPLQPTSLPRHLWCRPSTIVGSRSMSECYTSLQGVEGIKWARLVTDRHGQMRYRAWEPAPATAAGGLWPDYIMEGGMNREGTTWEFVFAPETLESATLLESPDNMRYNVQWHLNHENLLFRGPTVRAGFMPPNIGSPQLLGSAETTPKAKPSISGGVLRPKGPGPRAPSPGGSEVSDYSLEDLGNLPSAKRVWDRTRDKLPSSPGSDMVIEPGVYRRPRMEEDEESIFSSEGTEISQHPHGTPSNRSEVLVAPTIISEAEQTRLNFERWYGGDRDFVPEGWLASRWREYCQHKEAQVERAMAEQSRRDIVAEAKKMYPERALQIDAMCGQFPYAKNVAHLMSLMDARYEAAEEIRAEQTRERQAETWTDADVRENERRIEARALQERGQVGTVSDAASSAAGSSVTRGLRYDILELQKQIGTGTKREIGSATQAVKGTEFASLIEKCRAFLEAQVWNPDSNTDGISPGMFGVAGIVAKYEDDVVGWAKALPRELRVSALNTAATAADQVSRNSLPQHGANLSSCAIALRKVARALSRFNAMDLEEARELLGEEIWEVCEREGHLPDNDAILRQVRSGAGADMAFPDSSVLFGALKTRKGELETLVEEETAGETEGDDDANRLARDATAVQATFDAVASSMAAASTGNGEPPAVGPTPRGTAEGSLEVAVPTAGVTQSEQVHATRSMDALALPSSEQPSVKLPTAKPPGPTETKTSTGTEAPAIPVPLSEKQKGKLPAEPMASPSTRTITAGSVASVAGKKKTAPLSLVPQWQQERMDQYPAWRNGTSDTFVAGAKAAHERVMKSRPKTAEAVARLGRTRAAYANELLLRQAAHYVRNKDAAPPSQEVAREAVAQMEKDVHKVIMSQLARMPKAGARRELQQFGPNVGIMCDLDGNPLTGPTLEDSPTAVKEPLAVEEPAQTRSDTVLFSPPPETPKPEVPSTPLAVEIESVSTSQPPVPLVESPTAEEAESVALPPSAAASEQSEQAEVAEQRKPTEVEHFDLAKSYRTEALSHLRALPIPKKSYGLVSREYEEARDWTEGSWGDDPQEEKRVRDRVEETSAMMAPWLAEKGEIKRLDRDKYGKVIGHTKWGTPIFEHLSEREAATVQAKILRLADLRQWAEKWSGQKISKRQRKAVDKAWKAVSEAEAQLRGSGEIGDQLTQEEAQRWFNNYRVEEIRKLELFKMAAFQRLDTASQALVKSRFDHLIAKVDRLSNPEDVLLAVPETEKMTVPVFEEAVENHEQRVLAWWGNPENFKNVNLRTSTNFRPAYGADLPERLVSTLGPFQAPGMSEMVDLQDMLENGSEDRVIDAFRESYNKDHPAKDDRDREMMEEAMLEMEMQIRFYCDAVLKRNGLVAQDVVEGRAARILNSNTIVRGRHLTPVVVWTGEMEENQIFDTSDFPELGEAGPKDTSQPASSTVQAAVLPERAESVTAPQEMEQPITTIPTIGTVRRISTPGSTHSSTAVVQPGSQLTTEESGRGVADITFVDRTGGVVGYQV